MTTRCWTVPRPPEGRAGGEASLDATAMSDAASPPARAAPARTSHLGPLRVRMTRTVGTRSDTDARILRTAGERFGTSWDRLFLLEAVPQTPDGDDVRGLCGIGFDLGPHPLDVLVERLGVADVE